MLNWVIGICFVAAIWSSQGQAQDFAQLGFPNPKEPYERSRIPTDRFLAPQLGDPSSEIISRKFGAPFFFAPWTAALTTLIFPSQYLCNATVVSTRWLLTAAYCVDRISPQQLTVRYGTETVEKSASREVARIIIHPEYSSSRFQNAIALIEVRTPLDIIGVSKLPTISEADEPHSPQRASVFGWGTLTEGGAPSQVLTQVDVRIVPREICNSPIAYAGRISADMFCGQSLLPNLDVCQGFSGSGLIETVGAPKLLGLVSWGEGCGRENKPTVYINVARFKDWIEHHVRATR